MADRILIVLDELTHNPAHPGYRLNEAGSKRVNTARAERYFSRYRERYAEAIVSVFVGDVPMVGFVPNPK